MVSFYVGHTNVGHLFYHLVWSICHQFLQYMVLFHKGNTRLDFYLGHLCTFPWHIFQSVFTHMINFILWRPQYINVLALHIWILSITIFLFRPWPGYRPIIKPWSEFRTKNSVFIWLTDQATNVLLFTLLNTGQIGILNLTVLLNFPLFKLLWQSCPCPW